MFNDMSAKAFGQPFFPFMFHLMGENLKSQYCLLLLQLLNKHTRYRWIGVLSFLGLVWNRRQ